MNPKINCIDYMNKISFGISIAFCVLYSCTSHTGHKTSEETLQADSLAQDTIAETVAEPVVKKITPEEIQITKELLYDKYTLEDTYPYKDTTRSFQWDKIKETACSARKHTTAAVSMGYPPELQEQKR